MPSSTASTAKQRNKNEKNNNQNTEGNIVKPNSSRIFRSCILRIPMPSKVMSRLEQLGSNETHLVLPMPNVASTDLPPPVFLGIKTPEHNHTGDLQKLPTYTKNTRKKHALFPIYFFYLFGDSKSWHSENCQWIFQAITILRWSPIWRPQTMHSTFAFKAAHVAALYTLAVIQVQGGSSRWWIPNFYVVFVGWKLLL